MQVRLTKIMLNVMAKSLQINTLTTHSVLKPHCGNFKNIVRS